jgi:hypothetical protein
VKANPFESRTPAPIGSGSVPPDRVDQQRRNARLAKDADDVVLVVRVEARRRDIEKGEASVWVLT